MTTPTTSAAESGDRAKPSPVAALLARASEERDGTVPAAVGDTAVEERQSRSDGGTAVLLAAVPAALGIAGIAQGAAADAGSTGRIVVAINVFVWALAAAAHLRRRVLRPVGSIIAAFASVSGVAALVADVDFARGLALGAIPAVGSHLLLSLPTGHLTTPLRRRWVVTGYAIGLGAGAFAGATDALWPVIVAAIVLVGIAVPAAHQRYMSATALDRQRLQWVGCAVAVVVEAAIVLVTLRVLVDWPEELRASLAAVSVLIPLGFAAGTSRRFANRADRLLVHTVSVTGVSAVVLGVYLVIVLGLGRRPEDAERDVLKLSMLAAGVASFLYVPARDRLSRFANRLVYGEREAPEQVLRTFGSRLSRAIPLDELLLQLAESLRKTMGLVSAEVWTGSDGVIDRAVSVPARREHARIAIGPKELPVVTRAGVCGPAWMAVWLPQLLKGKEEFQIRVAPVTNSGELLGLLVVERKPDDEAFTDEDERVLTELARQVGLALHNVQLDSALQASLDEVRRQAEELAASRKRIVAASDAARRQIERNLHDGAQQQLVAMAVKMRIAESLLDSAAESGDGADDVQAAGTMLEELRSDLTAAIQELRALAHGIYPPLLVDRGLAEALRAAAGRAALPTTVDADGLERYSPEVEAAIYFCCLEAMQNAGKHAGEGATMRVTVVEEQGEIRFDVVDDGAGFSMADKGSGAGFVNMADRVGAIGGRIEVSSEPGKGVHITGHVPVEPSTTPTVL